MIVFRTNREIAFRNRQQLLTNKLLILFQRCDHCIVGSLELRQQLLISNVFECNRDILLEEADNSRKLLQSDFAVNMGRVLQVGSCSVERLWHSSLTRDYRLQPLFRRGEGAADQHESRSTDRRGINIWIFLPWPNRGDLKQSAADFIDREVTVNADPHWLILQIQTGKTFFEIR